MSQFHSSLWVNSLNENFKNGLPIGHKSINLSKKKYWHPLMSDFLLGIRHKTAIFNSHITKKSILQAFYMIAVVLKNNGHILIINTNQEYSHLTRNLSFLTLQKKSNAFSVSQSLIHKYNHLLNIHVYY